MSAIELLPLQPFHFDRRLAPRVRVGETIPIVLGRTDGTLVDISLRGARVLHRSAVGRGANVRFAFDWQGRHFAARATVVASRIVALDGPTYESRLHFAEVHHECETVLRELLATIANSDLRRAVENLRGSAATPTAQDSSSAAQGFIRCRYIAMSRWDKKWTRDAAQPDDGFTLPAALSDFEVAQVCRSYERIDAEGRQLLQRIARTIIADFGVRRPQSPLS